MRKISLAGTAILALSLSLMVTACSSTGSMTDASSSTGSSAQSEEMMTDDTTTNEPAMTAREGDFAGLYDKQVSGTVTVTDEQIVLSDFSSDEGPDLHVYLTNGTDEVAVTAGVEIDAVAFDQASQTFQLDDVAVSGYDTVVIHCDKAKAVFGAATLS